MDKMSNDFPNVPRLSVRVELGSEIYYAIHSNTSASLKALIRHVQPIACVH